MGDRTSCFGRTLCGAAATSVLLAGVWLAGTSAAAAMPAMPTPARDQASHYVQLAGLFGESDEEKAAREQREQAQDASIANLTQRVSDLEHALRQLTGQIEEANHRNVVLQRKIERMQKDFDYKLCQISARQLGASTDSSDDSGQPTIDCSALGQPSGGASGYGQQQSSLSPPQDQSGGAQAGVGSGVLGTLPVGTPMPHAQPSVSVNPQAVAGPSPDAGDRAKFNAAMNLLAKAQYDEARAAFRGYADAYPKDDLAPQAVYWVGSIAYVQKDYPGAARAFAEEIKEYPQSPRGPESMLKLGQSLLAMNQKNEGCTTLGALRSKYPHASKTIRREAEKARRAAHCR